MITTCNSPVAITRIRTFSVTCVMAFSTMPTDAESYFGGTSSIARTPKGSFNSLITTSRNANVAGPLSDLTINSGYPSLFNISTVSLIAVWSSTPLHWTNMLQIIILGLTFTTRNGVAALGVLSVVSVNEEPVIHACNKQTVLLFMPSFVNVRPPRATNANAAPIAIRVMTTCFVVAISWSGGFNGWIFDLAVLVSPTSPSPKSVHHGLVFFCLNEWFQRSFMWSHQSVPCHPIGWNFLWSNQHLFDEWKMLKRWSTLLNEKCCVSFFVFEIVLLEHNSLLVFLWVFANSAFFKWHKSIKFAKWTVFPSFFAGRTTSDFYFTFFTHHAGKFFNLSHYLSTAPCNWFSFLALGWSCPNFKTCTVYGRVVFWSFESLQLTHLFPSRSLARKIWNLVVLTHSSERSTPCCFDPYRHWQIVSDNLFMLALMLSHYIDVCQWDRECFIIKVVKLQSKFFMVSEKFSTHGPRIFCVASLFVAFFGFNIMLLLETSLCYRLRSCTIGKSWNSVWTRNSVFFSSD